MEVFIITLLAAFFVIGLGGYLVGKYAHSSDLGIAIVMICYGFLFGMMAMVLATKL